MKVYIIFGRAPYLGADPYVMGVYADKSDAEWYCNNYNEHDTDRYWIEEEPVIESEEVPCNTE